MVLLHLLGLLAWGAPAVAQNPLLEALEPGAERDADEPGDAAAVDPDRDPLLAIEEALAEARARVSALERARANGDPEAAKLPSSSLELATRLVRVLEQRREAQIRTNDLAAGREAIESVLARDPSELFGVPPPFPVPILDGVLQAWKRESEQEAQQETVVRDRRANLRLAEGTLEDLEKERRRLREIVQKEKDEVARIRRETELRALEDQLAIVRERVALAGQRLENATIEFGIKQIATRQSRAALAWVEAHLAPQEDDLADAIELLDRERFELDRRLGLARSRLVSAEATLRATEERAPTVDDAAEALFEAELGVRRRQLSHRQQIATLLGQRIERLGRMRASWQRRYAVLGDRLPLEEAPEWLDSTRTELERLTRLRRIHEAELAELRLDLATLLRKLTELGADAAAQSRFLELELEDLEPLIALYQEDLAALDGAIALDERLRAELSTRMEQRDLAERMQGIADSVRAFWSYELTASEDSPITPGKILIALAIFVLGYLGARYATLLLARRLFPRLGFDAGASNAFASLLRYALLAAAFLFALRAVNIPLTAFAVAGGALALGIGFGSQAIVSNFISGLLLLAERPIRTGDLVEIGGLVGTVEAIGLRSTRIRTPDNFHIIVPNSSFLESNVINWTHQDPKLRLRVVVGVAYGSPTRRVEELLVQAATEHPRTLANPAPMAVFRDFGDSALVFELRSWIRYDERTDRSLIQSDLRHRIDELFAEDGIVIAYPQMDVHLDVVEPAGAPSKSEPSA